MGKKSKKIPSVCTDIDYRKMLFSWSSKTVDLEAQWSFTNLESCLLYKEILPKLQEFCQHKWGYIETQYGGHHIDYDKLIKAAQSRLGVIEQDDRDAVFSLKISGKKRIFGIRDNACFILLWWDPNHEICPSELKHT